MSLINWIIGVSGSADRLVGSGNLVYPDALNRPLRQVFNLSNTDPDQDFEGFSLIGHTQSANTITAGIFSDVSYSFSTLLNINDLNVTDSASLVLLSASIADLDAIKNNQFYYTDEDINSNGGYLTLTAQNSISPTASVNTMIFSPWSTVFLGPTIPVNRLPTSLSAALTVYGVISGSSFSGSSANIPTITGNASTSTTASFALTASVALASSGTITNALSSSYALTASFAANGGGGGNTNASNVQPGTYPSGAFTYTGSLAITGSLYSTVNITYVTGTYSASFKDQVILVDASGSTASIYLLPLAKMQGVQMEIKKIDPGLYPVVIAPFGTDTIDYASQRILYNRTDGAVLLGTSDSWASDGFISASAASVSASYATTASAATSITFTPVTASYAVTASFALNGSGSGGGSSTNPSLIVPATIPSPTSGNITLYGKALGGNNIPAWIDHIGQENVFQSAIRNRRFCVGVPQDLSWKTYGGPSPSIIGTVTSAFPTNATPSKPKTRQYRYTIATTGTSGSFFSYVGSGTNPLSSIYDGFMWKVVFSLDLFQTSSSLFMGMGNSNVNTIYCSASNPSQQTSTELIGIGFDAPDGGNVINIYTCNGTTLTKVSTGQIFNIFDVFAFTLICAPNDSTVYFKLEDITTNTILISTGSNVTLPNSASFLREQISMNTSVSGVNQIGLLRTVLESNN